MAGSLRITSTNWRPSSGTTHPEVNKQIEEPLGITQECCTSHLNIMRPFSQCSSFVTDKDRLRGRNDLVLTVNSTKLTKSFHACESILGGRRRAFRRPPIAGHPDQEATRHPKFETRDRRSQAFSASGSTVAPNRISRENSRDDESTRLQANCYRNHSRAPENLSEQEFVSRSSRHCTLAGPRSDELSPSRLASEKLHPALQPAPRKLGTDQIERRLVIGTTSEQPFFKVCHFRNRTHCHHEQARLSRSFF